MDLELPAWAWPAALIAVCLIAVRRGGDEERLAAGGVLLAWALTILAYRSGSQEAQWQILLIDGAMLGFYIWLAMRSRRYWPMFAAAFKLLAVITHLVIYLKAGVSGWAYWTAQIIWSYLALFTIGYAAWTAPRYAALKAEPTGEAGAPRR